MVILRQQIAGTEDNLTALATPDKETFDEVDKFQPDEQFGRAIEILMIEFSAMTSFFADPIASASYCLTTEYQISTSSKFGGKQNVLATLMLPIGMNVGSTTIGGVGPIATHDMKVLGNLQFPMATIRIPGAIYLHVQMWNKAGTALVAGILKTQAEATVFFRQL